MRNLFRLLIYFFGMFFLNDKKCCILSLFRYFVIVFLKDMFFTSPLPSLGSLPRWAIFAANATRVEIFSSRRSLPFFIRYLFFAIFVKV